MYPFPAEFCLFPQFPPQDSYSPPIAADSTPIPHLQQCLTGKPPRKPFETTENQYSSLFPTVFSWCFLLRCFSLMLNPTFGEDQPLRPRPPDHSAVSWVEMVREERQSAEVLLQVQLRDSLEDVMLGMQRIWKMLERFWKDVF